jgi:outer membrane lipoprotein-sorting protein
MDHGNIHEDGRRRGFSFYRNVTLFLIALFAAGNALADLPTGEEIMQRKIEALGGQEALARRHNILTKGKMSISGVEMNATIYTAEPNLNYVLFESPMIGKMESGCNGETAWELSVMQGANVKEGKELTKALFDAEFNSELNWQDRYTSIDVQAEEEVEGKTCCKVVLTPTVGDTITTYFDMETWLTVRTETVRNSSVGRISVVSDFSDYREVDGVKVPFKTEVLLMGAQQMITTIESMEFNVKLPEGIFDLPEEIQAMLDAEKPAGD